MSSEKREVFFLLHHFLNKENYTDTLHTLEKESGIFFNMKFFEDSVLDGDLDVVEKYLLGFSTKGDEEFFRSILFKIREQKCLEALQRNDSSKALEILSKEMGFNADVAEENIDGLASLLLRLVNFREHEILSAHADCKSARSAMLIEVKKMIVENPKFRDALQFDAPENPTLRTLIQQRYDKHLGGSQYPTSMGNPASVSDNIEKSKICKLSSQLHSPRLPDNLGISRLTYTSSGGAILALACNAVHTLWRWKKNDENVSGTALINILPHLMQPSSEITITDISEKFLEETTHCLAITKNEAYFASASGGKVSLYHMSTLETLASFMDPPPAATFIEFHPEDYNLVAIGMEDSSILIYNIKLKELKSTLKHHQKRVTGLAFSNALKVLVSSGADDRLCVWGMDGWDLQTSNLLKIPSGRYSSPLAQTRVQFHQDQVHVLVVCESHLAIYEAPKLDYINQWFPQGSNVLITDATYSCDGQSIYACLKDGSVSILVAETFTLTCCISPTVYITPDPSSKVHSLVVAAHPTKPNQIALGLSDGRVVILEPLEGEGKWGTES